MSTPNLSKLERNERAWVYDIESYNNLWSAYFINVVTGERKAFLIYEQTNMFRELITFVHSEQVEYLVGFNSYFFDDMLLSYMIENRRVLINYETNKLAFILNKATDYIINGNKQLRIKRTDWFKSVDLYKMLGFKRSNVSLKRIAVYLGMEDIQDLPFPVGSSITPNNLDIVLKYNRLDVNVTKALMHHASKELSLREFMEEKFDTHFYNADSTYLGKIIFIDKFNKKVSPEFQISMGDLRKWRTTRSIIELKDVIADFVKFETPHYQKILEDLKETKVSMVDGKFRVMNDDKRKFTEFKYKAIVSDGLNLTIGLGGLHDTHTKWMVNAEDDEFLAELDAAAYYPNLMALLEAVPEHFKEVAQAFIDTIKELIEERLFFKYAKEKTAFTKMSDYILKIAINSLFGLLGSEYFAFFDPAAVLKVTVNGELGLLKAIEMLENKKIKVISANTDGVVVYTSRENESAVRQIAKDWEDIYKLELEVSEYKKIVQNHVNSYIWIKESGEIKQKGDFLAAKDRRYDQSVNQTIVIDAINKYFLSDIPIETTINECDDIMKFTMTKRLGTEKTSGLQYELWTVDDEEYPVAKQQKTTRFYCSTQGHQLKRVGTKQSAFIIKDQPVVIFNNYVKKDFVDYGVDKTYYIQAAQKIVAGFHHLKI